MFFGKKIKYLSNDLKSKTKASLRACHKQTDPNKCDILNNPKNIKIAQRTFFLTPSEYQASMCLEASLSFSLFIIFFVNILSVITLFATYTEALAGLQQQGKKMAAYAYITEGTLGSNEDIIRLQKNIKIQFPVGIIGTSKYCMTAQCVVKPWTGYDVSAVKNRADEDAIVYMTDYGNVYHKNRSCTHLALSIRAVGFVDVKEKRNEEGEVYEACEYCGENGIVTIVFITSYGNKYHTTTKCQGLKRTIKAIPLSEVKGVDPCQKCG